MIARGRTQQYYWGMMTSSEGCPSVTYLTRGRARNYLDLYQISFRNMCERAKKEGWSITRTPGKRGGEWGANYYAIPPKGGIDV